MRRKFNDDIESGFKAALEYRPDWTEIWIAKDFEDSNIEFKGPGWYKWNSHVINNEGIDYHEDSLLVVPLETSDDLFQVNCYNARDAREILTKMCALLQLPLHEG